VTLEDEIREYLVSKSGGRVSAAELTDDYPLIEHDVLDSMGIFQFVDWIERKLGIEIDDEDFSPESFATITTITEMIHSYQSA
jgi:acyl carrier protein